MVPAGHEIPVSEALIYVSQQPPEAIPSGVYCDQCDSPPGFTHAYSDAKGNFVLSGVPVGTWWVVIQKGQFRLDQQVVVSSEFAVMLDTAHTTLPSDHDPANGKWLPRIALSEGLWDEMEDITGKMGIGMVDGTGSFIGSSATDNMDLYLNGSGSHGALSVGSLDSLIGSLNKMMEYHIILVPCSNGDTTSLFGNTTWRNNIREYVKAGGKFYVTDWSGEWADVPFPAFVVFDSGYDTTDAACSGFTCGDSDGSPSYESDGSMAVDEKMNPWLEGQVGPLVGGTTGTMLANNFAVEGNWNHINGLGTVNVGNDMNGNPIMETAKVWVMGNDGSGQKPLTVTYEPAGCGRVLYSTYHTADSTHVGLIPQERVLMYLLMEIGTCKDGPIVE
jgi:hypothetical protein